MPESDGRRETDACRQICFNLSDLFLECNYCINQGVPVFSVKLISEKLIGKDGERRDHGLTRGTTWHLPGWTDKIHKKPQSGQMVCQL
jgi:hypothetical protein